MSKLTRHILFELIKVFLIALLGMTTFMILVGLVEQAIKEGLGVAPILQLIPYVLPNALRFAVPGTILFAACSVYGRLSANNEVVAVKSLGISPVALLRPAWALAFLVSLVAVWLNDIAVSWGTRGMRRVVIQSIEEIAYGMLRTRKSYTPTDQLSISVQRVDGKRLIRPTIAISGPDGASGVMVTATSAEMRYNATSDTLSVYLTEADVTGDVGEQFHGRFPTLHREIPLHLAAKDEMGEVRPSDCPSRNISREMEHQRMTIDRLKTELAAQAAFEMFAGNLDSFQSDVWAKKRRELGYAKSRWHRLHTEPWRRWANGFSCFFFVVGKRSGTFAQRARGRQPVRGRTKPLKQILGYFVLYMDEAHHLKGLAEMISFSPEYLERRTMDMCVKRKKLDESTLGDALD